VCTVDRVKVIDFDLVRSSVGKVSLLNTTGCIVVQQTSIWMRTKWRLFYDWRFGMATNLVNNGFTECRLKGLLGRPCRVSLDIFCKD
jgi:hypothetical protein